MHESRTTVIGIRSALVAICLLGMFSDVSHVVADPLPSGHGISRRHPADENIAKHPSVLFAENFETGSIEDVTKRWGSANNDKGKVLSFAEDTMIRDAGRRCLEMTATLNENTGGNLYKKLNRGVDRAYARFYVKFPKDAGYIHHFVTLGGYNPATNWPQGGAGVRPKGHDRFTVGIEPYGFSGREKPPGRWNFYTYWHEMKASNGNKYWGNSLSPQKPLVVPCDKWQAVEVMIKCNTPGKRDGELALWLDGQSVMHIKQGTKRTRWTGMGFQLPADANEGEPFEGFSWRTTKDLKVNFFWLLHYVTPEALRRNGVKDLPKTVSVRFDNVVVATEYIGPLMPWLR